MASLLPGEAILLCRHRHAARQRLVQPPQCLDRLPAGITRGLVITICRETGIPVVEKNLSLTEFYTADEVFTTGTMGELTRVEAIDGRRILNRRGARLPAQIEAHFRQRTEAEGTPLPF